MVATGWAQAGSGAGTSLPALPGEDWLAGWQLSGWLVQCWAPQQQQLPPARGAQLRRPAAPALLGVQGGLCPCLSDSPQGQRGREGERSVSWCLLEAKAHVRTKDSVGTRACAGKATGFSLGGPPGKRRCHRSAGEMGQSDKGQPNRRLTQRACPNKRRPQRA